jgi:hypothetical protein
MGWVFQSYEPDPAKNLGSGTLRVVSFEELSEFFGRDWTARCSSMKSGLELPDGRRTK